MIGQSFDNEIAARTCWMEARGEGLEGMRAIAWVILNRQRSGKWFGGKTLAAICWRPYQFSCWNDHDPNRMAVAVLAFNDALLEACRGYIAEALLAQAEDPTHGATHYYAASIPKPGWALGATLAAHIGAHHFYKDVG